MSAGQFSTTLGPINPVCVRGHDIFVEVEVSEDIASTPYVALEGRQQLFAAASATTSGAGDFHVGGDFTVTGTGNIANLDVPGRIIVDGNLTAGSMNSTGTINGGNIATSGFVSSNSVSTGSISATNVSTSVLSVGSYTFANSLQFDDVAADAAAIGSTTYGVKTFSVGSSGRGIMMVSASGYRGSAGTFELNVYVDNAYVGKMSAFSNEASSHKTVPTRFFRIATSPNSSHTLEVRPGTNAQIDFNDRMNAGFIRLP